MENRWRNKCNLGWHSPPPPPPPPPPPLASSSRVLLEPESRIQMESNIGHYFYPYVAQEQRSADHGIVQESLHPNTSNFTPSTSHSVLGSSFLSLLSGPPMLLQCDLQQLSSPKQYAAPGQFSIEASNVMVSASGSGVLMDPNGKLSGIMGNGLKNASDLWTVVSPRALLSTHRGRSVLPDDLQAAKLNLHSLDLAEAVGHHIVPSTEKVNDFSSPRGGLQACTSLSDVGEKTNILSSQHISPEANSFVFNAAAPLTSDCPRVFCLGTSGDLLLSNVGLFGIVCSCHHFHLSVARFCEHSGLVDVNPGNAVHMDSGETIAQWRKVYFHKFGIRVPEDHCGWDWPQGFSPTAGFMKHNASKSNVSRSSNSLEVFGLLGEAVRPGQLCYDASPRSFWANQKSVNDASANVQLKETQGHSSNFLPEDLIASSQKNLHAIADGRLMECPIPRCSTMSTIDGCGGLSSICQTISAYGDLISSSEDPFMSSQTFRNLRTSGKGSDRGQFNNPKEEISADKFAASSNVDLRLGQPHQQGQMLGNSVLSAIRLPLLNKVGDSQSLLLQDHQISTSKLMDYGQCLQCPTTSSNSGTRMEHNQSSLLNHSFGGHTAIDSTKLRQLKCDAAESSVISTILSQSNIPSGRNGHSKAFNNVVSGSDQLMPRTPHCEAYTTRSDLIKLRNSTDVSKRLMDINGPSLYNHMGGDIRTSGPNSECYKKMDDSATFHGFVGVNGKLNRSAACEKNQLPGVPLDAFHSVTPFSYSGKGSSIGSTGHLDHNSNRPKSPSMGFSLASSVATQNSAPIFSYKEGNGLCSCMLDENLRLHLLRNTIELSNKQKHRVSCLGMDQEQRNLPSSCYANIQRPVSTPEEQSHGVIPTKWHAASEVAAKSLQSGATCQMPEGLNNWYDISSCVQGISLQPKESEVQCHLTHNSSNVRPSLRIGGTGNISLSSENGACCQSLPCAYVQNRCCCAIHGELKSCEPKSETSFDDIKEGVSGSGKTFTLASNSHNNHMSPASFDLSGNSKIHPPKTIACLASQWRDVPSKVSNMTYVNQPADLPDKRGSVTDESVDAGSLKENETSNISSGSLAPVVTQASIEVDNVGSCTVNAGDTRYADRHVVDEGSEIGKCWSSDDALDSGKSSEFVGIESSVEVGNKSSCGLVNKCKRRDSFRMKRAQNQVYPSEKVERNYKTGKRRRVVNPKMLDASIYASDFFPPHFESPKSYGTKWSCQSSGGFKATLQSGQGTSHAFSASSIGPSSKRKRSVLSAAETLLLKRNCPTLYDYSEGIDDCQKEKLKGIADFLENPDDKSGKKSEWDVASYNTGQQSQLLGQHCANVDRSSKFNAAYNSKSSPSRLLSVGNGKKAKPIVSGEFGVISNGDITLDASKSAKIVSLSRVLKAAKRCTLEPELASVNELKNLNLSGGCYNGISAWKKQRNIATRNAKVCNEVDSDIVMEERENACLIVDELFVSDKEIDEGRTKGCNTLDGCFSTQMKLKGKNSGSPKFSSAKILKSAPRSRCRSAKLLEHAKENKCCTIESHTVNVHKPIKEHQCESPVLDSDAFCCVCGSSDRDEINCLLECSQCLIRVHQACYGVSKVPNSCWYCRPCQESAQDIVCVLCGYGGGAMTQALQSSIVVKSLLRAWNVLPEYRPKVTNPSEVWKDKLKLFSISGLEVDSTLALKPLKAEGATTVWKFGLQKQLGSSCSPSNRNACNSITAGLLDSTVKQWVHMVCGLWTPGTCCPNVNTMNAFDVSGVLRRRVNVVCSMCNRPGGSCIKCRVPNCSVRFHPWCAHQKGLLQSEIEGIDNESVGFYGRCLLHELHPQHESCSGPIDAKMTCPGENGSTCARTEGYKGRKWEGFQHSLHCQSSHDGGCLVPQAQLNAWLHINGRKPCAKALSKSLITDVESDCRKEYARFKQAKGWKNLVVYKSGIHALGLYTSQFIARGAMVVEYVGEIVGSRVADKREIEYQSWKKLQYKSACYFFRIDKEHIVDATCKGGIARFVNHSCLPNCVAKVISVRNEKKVVFLAERDIYPGEEITYDYHFNREDEGKKIPCFCNSKKCKRYLN